MTTKYLVDIEFRYLDAPKGDNDYPQQKSKTVTIGVYDTYEDAVKYGNRMLENNLENRFPLNPNWRKKERFGERYTETLISGLGYLTTPFSFFAHIKKLEFDSIDKTIDLILEAEKRYKDTK